MVMLSIMNGELPEKPDSCGNPFIFSKLWALCDSCWSSLRPGLPRTRFMAYLASVSRTSGESPCCSLLEIDGSPQTKCNPSTWHFLTNIEGRRVQHASPLLLEVSRGAQPSLNNRQLIILFKSPTSVRRFITHSLLWAPTPRKLDTANSNTQALAASSPRRALPETQTDTNLPPVIHNTIPILTESGTSIFSGIRRLSLFLIINRENSAFTDLFPAASQSIVFEKRLFGVCKRLC